MATVNAEMSNLQLLPVGVDVFDKDGQPFATLPSGVTIEFKSSDPSVVSVEIRPDGMNADLRSGKVGASTITVHATGLTPQPPDETIEVKVTNSSPGSLNVRVGAPTDE